MCFPATVVRTFPGELFEEIAEAIEDDEEIMRAMEGNEKGRLDFGVEMGRYFLQVE